MKGELKSLGDIVEFKYGNALPERVRLPGDVGVYGSNGLVGTHTEAITDGATVIVGRKGSVGEVNFSAQSCWPIDTTYYIDASVTDADLKWLYYALQHLRLPDLNRATGVPGLNRNDAYLKKLYVPPLDEQRRIAAILDQADALRRKRREAVLKIETLSRALLVERFGTIKSPTGPRIPLGDIATFKGGGTPSRTRAEYYDGDICWASSKDMTSQHIRDTQEHISNSAIADSATNLMPAGTVLVVVKSKILMHRLPVAVAEIPLCFNQDIKGISGVTPYSANFIMMSLLVDQDWLLRKARGANTEGLTLDHLRAFPIASASKGEIDDFERDVKLINTQSEKLWRSLGAIDAIFSALQANMFASRQFEAEPPRVAAE